VQRAGRQTARLDGVMVRQSSDEMGGQQLLQIPRDQANLWQRPREEQQASQRASEEAQIWWWCGAGAARALVPRWVKLDAAAGAHGGQR
jgi:hypothetical protein